MGQETPPQVGCCRATCGCCTGTMNNNPEAKAYERAVFHTDDVQADYEGMKARGAEFTMPPRDVTAPKSRC